VQVQVPVTVQVPSLVPLQRELPDWVHYLLPEHLFSQ